MDGGCRGVKADIGKVIARGLQGHRLSTTVDIATIQSPDTHPSDNSSLRGSRRVNVPKEGTAYALGNTGRADGLLKPGGHILADTCIDGEWSAVLQSTVDAQLDASQGLMGGMDRQCLCFTVVDIGRAAGIRTAWSLLLVSLLVDTLPLLVDPLPLLVDPLPLLVDPLPLLLDPLALAGVVLSAMGDPLTATARTTLTMVKSFAENIMVRVDKSEVL